MKTSKKILLSTISASMAGAPILGVVTSCNKSTPKIIVEPTQEEKTKVPSEGLWFDYYAFTLTESLEITDINIKITSTVVNNIEENFSFIPIYTSGKSLICIGTWLEIPNKDQTINFDIEIENIKTGTKQSVTGLSLKYKYIGELTTIAVKKLPTQASYNYNDNLNLEGLVLTGTFSLGKTIDIPFIQGIVDSSPHNGDQLQTKNATMPILVKLGELTTSFDVEIKPIVLSADVTCSSISMAVGDKLYPSDLLVYATYSNDKTKIVQEWTSQPAIPADGYRFNKMGTQKFDIYHKDYKQPITSVVFDVNERYFKDMYVTPTKMHYKYGETITKEDFTVTVEWSDGSTQITDNYETNIPLPHVITEEEINVGYITIRFTRGACYKDVTLNLQTRVIDDVKISFNTEMFGVKSIVNLNDFNITASFDGKNEYMPISYGTGLDQYQFVSPAIDLSSGTHSITAEEAAEWKNFSSFIIKINGVQYTGSAMPITTGSVTEIHSRFNPLTYKAGTYITEDDVTIQLKFSDSNNLYKIAYSKDTTTPEGIGNLPYQVSLDDAEHGTGRACGFHYNVQGCYAYIWSSLHFTGATIDNLLVSVESPTVLTGYTLKPENLIVAGVLTGNIKTETLVWNSGNGYKIYWVKDDGTEIELTSFDKGFGFANSGEYTFKIVASNTPTTTKLITITAVETGQTTVTFHPGEESTSPNPWQQAISRGQTVKDIPEGQRTPEYEPTLYDFAGWSTSKNGPIYDINKEIFTSELNLYAIYIPKYVSLDYCVKAEVLEQTKVSLVQSDPSSILPDVTYSLDGKRWYPIGTSEILLPTYTRFYIRGNNINGFSKENAFNTIRFNGGVVQITGGNIMSLLTNGKELTDEEAKAYIKPYGFAHIFENCSTLNSIYADFLQVPAIENNLFERAFAGCTGLGVAPNLVDKDLKPCCYKEMFKGCTNLMSLPKNLRENSFKAGAYPEQCYYGTFENCTSIADPISFGNDTFAPLLGENAFSNMYKGCNSIQISKDKASTNKLILKLGNAPANVFNDMFTYLGKNISPASNETWYIFSNIKNGIDCSITSLELKSHFRSETSTKGKDPFIHLNDFNAATYNEWTNTAGYVQTGNHFQYKNTKKNDDYRHIYHKFKINFLCLPYTEIKVKVTIKVRTWCYSNSSIMFVPTWNAVSGELFDYGFTAPTKNHYVGTAYGLHEAGYKEYKNKAPESIYADGFNVKCDFSSHSKESSLTFNFSISNKTDRVAVFSRYLALATSVEGCMNVSHEVSGDKEGSSDWTFAIEAKF